MQKFTRFLKLLPVLALVVVLLTTAALAANENFDKENFVGLVLKNTEPSTVTVKLYDGWADTSDALMTPVYTDGGDQYYEVKADTKYMYVAKPTTGYARYNEHRCIYISAADATKKTELDVTPAKRSTAGWDPPKEVRYYTEATLKNIYPSSPDLWPQYAEFFTTPAFTISRTPHKQTTQTEMMNYINGLDSADDKMHVYILGKSEGDRASERLDIPMVLFTATDLSSATTLEEAAALVKANGKLTVHYQAQIHGDEPAGCEAALGMIKRLRGAYGDKLLEKMNIYVIPRLNPTGAYNSLRVAELADGTTTDPNRDFLHLQTASVQARMRAYNLFDPEVVFDNHEYQLDTNYYRVKKLDLQVCCHPMLNFTQDYQDTSIALAHAAFDQLKADGLGYGWYNESMGGLGGNTGSSNTAMRGTFHILMESGGVNRGLLSYERRVAAHASGVTGILNYLEENAQTVQNIIKEQRRLLVENGKTYDEKDQLIFNYKSVDRPDQHIVGQMVNLHLGTVYSNKWDFTASAPGQITRSRTAPTAYVIPAGESYTDTVLALMDKQGISYDFIPAGNSVYLQQYTLVAVSEEDGMITEAGLTQEKSVAFPNGAYAFTMDQVDREILACLMEPDMNIVRSQKGSLVHQDIITETNGMYPIYRYIRDLNADGEIDYAKMSAAPEGLAAVDATKIGGTGKITGLDTTKAYEYRAADAFAYTAVAAGSTEITDLPVGKYYVRFAATATGDASAEAVVEIGYGVLDEYVVFLDSAGGAATNDGYTDKTPVNTIELAHSQLDKLMETAPAGSAGKIVIVGTYTISNTTNTYQLPKHDYPLVITGGKLIYKDVSGNKHLCLGGDTTFDDITLKVGSASDSYFLFAQGHKLVIGEHVTTEPYTSGSSKYYFAVAGGNNGTVAKTDVTILSGYWYTVYAGGRNGKVTGNSKLVAKNCSITRATASRACTVEGDVYISLENVESRSPVVCGNTNSGNVKGNVTLVLGEGVTTSAVYAGSNTDGNVEGKVTIVADGIDLTKTPIYGKANNTSGTVGSLKLVVNKGELADVAETFVTMDGTEIVLGCDQTKAATLSYSCDLDLAGHDAAITVASGKTLTVCDTTEGELGVLAATGTTAPAEGYQEIAVTGGKSYPKAAAVLPGDMDGDSDMDTDDAVYLLLSVMFGEEDYPIAVAQNRDVNKDGKLDTDDAVYLLLHVMFGAEDYPI